MCSHRALLLCLSWKCTTWETADSGSRTSTPAAHMKNPGGIPGSWPSPTHCSSLHLFASLFSSLLPASLCLLPYPITAVQTNTDFYYFNFYSVVVIWVLPSPLLTFLSTYIPQIITVFNLLVIVTRWTFWFLSISDHSRCK